MKLIPYNQISSGQNKLYRKVSFDSNQYLVSLDTVDFVLAYASENDCFPKTFEAYVVSQKIPSCGVKVDRISDENLLSVIARELEKMTSINRISHLARSLL